MDLEEFFKEHCVIGSDPINPDLFAVTLPMISGFKTEKEADEFIKGVYKLMVDIRTEQLTR